MRKLVTLVIALMLSVASFSQTWEILSEDLLTDTCVFIENDYSLVTVINGQDILIDRKMYNNYTHGHTELVLVTWSNGNKVAYSIREIYKKEAIKDLKFVLSQFSNMLNTLNPDALSAIESTDQYFNILWLVKKWEK